MRNQTTASHANISERIPIQAIKYAASAFGGFAADYVLLLVLKEWVGLHYLIAVPIAFIAGIVVNYLIGIWFVFRSRYLTLGKELILFLVISLIALAVTEGSMYLFTDLLRVDYRISRLITGAVTYLFNFFSRRLLIYRVKRESMKIE